VKILDVLAGFLRAKSSAARATTELVSAESFPEDPSLPQLKTALDCKLMREVFQKHLQPLGEEAFRVRECQITRILYRQGKRCILQYTLHLEDLGVGGEWSQRVTGAMYAGHRTRRIWKRLQRSEPEHRISNASPALAPFFYIFGLDMLVQVFPYDRRLPALPILLAGPLPELEALLLAQFGPGDWQAEAWDTEPLRYLAELRATLRLTARARDGATGRAEEKHFYAKVYENEETGQQTYRVLQALWDRASTGSVGFTVGRPIAYLSDLQTILQEEVPGTSLRDVLLQEDEAIPAARKAARALVSLNLDNMAAPRRYSWHSFQKDPVRVESLGKLLQWLCPHPGSKVDKIIGAIVAGLEEVPPAPSHGDLHPDHIIFDGDRVALIDLDQFGEGDPVLDVAAVLAFLVNAPFTWLPLPYDRACKAARAFAEEYFAHVPEAWRTRLPLLYALAVLELAANLFRYQEPGWPDKIEALVKEAEDSLAGRVW
jgi:hypothetical protein